MPKFKICVQNCIILTSQDLLASKVQPVQSSFIYLVLKRKVSSSFNCWNIKKVHFILLPIFLMHEWEEVLLVRISWISLRRSVCFKLHSNLQHFSLALYLPNYFSFRVTTSYSVSIQIVMMLKVPLFASEWAYEYFLNCLKLLLNLT